MGGEREREKDELVWMIQGVYTFIPDYLLITDIQYHIVYLVIFAMISFSLFSRYLLNHKLLNIQKLYSVSFSIKKKLFKSKKFLGCNTYSLFGHIGSVLRAEPRSIILVEGYIVIITMHQECLSPLC